MIRDSLWDRFWDKKILLNCIPAAAAEAAEEAESEGSIAPADVSHEVAEELELRRLDGADDVLREADDLQESDVRFTELDREPSLYGNT